LSGPTSIKLTPVETAPDESGVPDDEDEEEEVPEWTEPSDNADDTTSLSVVWKVCMFILLLSRGLMVICCHSLKVETRNHQQPAGEDIG